MPERPLPELTPEMLLSYGGMRELEGARAMQQTRAPLRSHDDHVDAVIQSMASAAVVDDEITFDNDYNLDAEIEASSNFRTSAVGNRFNVLRPPQHEPFRPPPPMSGPQGGSMREVGRVGRFPILTDGPRPVIDIDPDPTIPPRQLRFDNPAQSPRASAAGRGRPSAAELNAKQAEKLAAVHETLPTAYDRLMDDDDPYEDDLE